jgi:toxin ParE1/3/4
LIEKTKVLGIFPLSGRVVPEFGDRLIRELILKPYRIVYRIDEAAKVVGVARYWHGARGDLRVEALKS